MLNVSDGEDKIVPADGASQVTDIHSSITFNTSSVLKRIKLERKRAELRNFEEKTKLKTRKIKLLAELDKEEALTKLRLGGAHLEAEEKALEVQYVWGLN